MTEEAKLARQLAGTFEARLEAEPKQSRDGARLKIELTMLFQDAPPLILEAMSGDVFVMAAVLVDGGIPIHPDTLRAGRRANAYAHSISRDPSFQRWAAGELLTRFGILRGGGHNPINEATARDLIVRVCGIVERGDMMTNKTARAKFNALCADYRDAVGQTDWRPMKEMPES